MSRKVKNSKPFFFKRLCILIVHWLLSTLKIVSLSEQFGLEKSCWSAGTLLIKSVSNILVFPFFSRRFMKWKATIIVTLFFLSTRTDQNSSTKVLQNIIASKCTIWSSELNQKGFPVFPRNIPYRARPKTPPFHFFRHCDTFFSKKNFSPKGPPCIFLMFCDRMDVKESQRVPPFSFFRHCEIFFRKWKFLFSSIFSCFATEWMLKNLKGSTLSVFRHCETLATRSSFFEWVIFSKNYFSKNFDFRVL